MRRIRTTAIVNFSFMVVMLIGSIFSMIFNNLYYAAPIGTESEALYLSLLNIFNTVQALGVLSMCVTGIMLFVFVLGKRKE